MSKILFILDYYYPTPSPNAICAKRVMDYLKEENEVICLTADNNNFLTKEIIDGIEIWRTKKRLQYRFVEFCNHKITNGNNFYKLIKFLGRCIIKIKNILYSPIWPLVSFNLIRRFTLMAEEIIMEKNIDTIVALSYPYESLMATCNIKKKYKNIKCLGFFLDVTSIGKIGSKGVSRKISIWSSLRLERKVVDILDSCIILDNAKELYFKNHHNNNEKMIIADIPLIVNQKRIELNEKNNSRIRIVYTGSLQKNVRDPRFILELINRLPVVIKPRIEIYFYGKTGNVFEGWDDQKLNNYNVKLFGHVSESEADEAINSADCLLSLGNQDQYLIPSKIFKYINTQKKIIHFASAQYDPCIKYLNYYPKSLIINKNCSSNIILKQLENFLFSTDSNDTIIDVEELYPKSTAKYTAEAIKSSMII